MRRITIDPVTRLEGHAKIDIFLDDSGNVENAYFQVVELRGFEKFCEGRPAEEMPRITPRICGVCPGAHHVASTKTLDDLYGVEPTSAAKKLRELFYCAHYVHSHMAHFYALAAPDFIPGPDADPPERNILGLVGRVGLEAGSEVIKHRAYAQEIQELLGGKATHPVCGLPGGVSRGLSEEERASVEEKARSCVEFAKFSLGLFEDSVLGNDEYRALIKHEGYELRTHNMGLVDADDRVSFYDGEVRVVDTKGAEIARFSGADYLDHVAEHVEPWSYLKFPYLKSKGWKGLVVGDESGIFRVGPLGRLNAADGMATPLAQEAYEKFYDTLGASPVHATLATHWARLIEIMYASERMLELARDEEITSGDIRRIPESPRGRGIGIVEAPRGTLIHHYETDDEGIIQKVNLIVATVHNHGAICASVKRAAEAFVRGGEVEQGMLNRVEMAFRAYDPCLGCATHALWGEMPIEIALRDSRGSVIRTMSR